jgi:head-tail adaptor
VTAAMRLSRRLVLEARVAVADGAGGWTVSWSAVGTLWASMAALSGREDFVAGQPRPRPTWRILVRAAPVGAPSRPRPEQRFREGERVFDILTVAERDPGGRYLEILAEEGIGP